MSTNSFVRALPVLVALVLAPAIAEAQTAPPESAAPPAPQYGAPQYGAPQYGPPQYAPPQYGPPQYAPPQYGPPQYAPPQYAPPQAPRYSARPSAYAAPYRAPYYSTRARERPIVGYRNVERPDPTLWGPGLALLLAGWVLDFAVVTPLANSLSDDRSPAVEEDAWAWSFVPIIGPWIQLGIGAPHPAMPLTLGLVQGAGLALLLVGLATNSTLRVPIYEGDPEDRAAPRVDLSAAPAPGGGTLGLTLSHL